MPDHPNQPDDDAAQPHDFDAASPESEAQPADDQAAVTPMQKLELERDELHQRLLRVSADYQNFIRRSRSEVAAAQQQQLLSMARELVTVLDHLDHAVEVDPAKTSTDQLMQGVLMVRDELMRTLGRFGVQRIEVTVGDVFDPNRHEAMMRQPSDAVESNHVAAQLQPGYALADKTIRPAKVTVAE